MTYVCKDCGDEFKDMPYDSECPTCGCLVVKNEDVEISNSPMAPKIKGENGLVSRKSLRIE